MSEFSTPQELNELSFLVARCLDGSISREETKRLETLLESKKELRDYYRKYVSIYCDREARELGLPVNDEIPKEVLYLLHLYPQPVRRQPTVEYVPEPRRLKQKP